MFSLSLFAAMMSGQPVLTIRKSPEGLEPIDVDAKYLLVSVRMNLSIPRATEPS